MISKYTNGPAAEKESTMCPLHYKNWYSAWGQHYPDITVTKAHHNLWEEKALWTFKIVHPKPLNPKVFSNFTRPKIVTLKTETDVLFLGGLPITLICCFKFTRQKWCDITIGRKKIRFILTSFEAQFENKTKWQQWHSAPFEIRLNYRHNNNQNDISYQYTQF